MSRRATLLVLAASVALIATPAAADPECFGQPCHLPEAVEPPPATMLTPETADASAPEANAAALPEVAPVKASPVAEVAPIKALPVAEVVPIKALPQVVAAPRDEPQPMARRPLPKIKIVADVEVTPREPAKLAPRPIKDTLDVKDTPVAAPLPSPPPSRVADAGSSSYARAARVSSPEPSYVVGYNTAPVGGIVVVVPGMAYAAGQRPTYLFAPGAKIISVDSGD